MCTLTLSTLSLDRFARKVFVAEQHEKFRERILEEEKFKAAIVWLIANGKAEQALERLAKHFGVKVPVIRVGLPKGRRRGVFGCYTAKNATISVLDSDRLKDPFVVLHEFYHHVRTRLDGEHKGTERYADAFAKEFLRAYRTMATETSAGS